MRHAEFAPRLFGRPLLMDHRHGVAWLDTFAQLLHQRQDLRLTVGGEREARPAFASLPVGLVERDYSKSFAQVRDVAVLQVGGVLVNALGSVNSYWGMTGYDGLRTQLAAAMNDPAVKAICLLCDSPGGEVAGCFDLADQIRDARETKPIWAIVDSMACSAAFALAVGAGRIVCSSVGFTGSVGVITAHYDWTKALEIYGVKVTLIYAGAHKADGSPHVPLTDPVKAIFQKEIDTIAGLFVDVVAKGRGIAADAITATEAQSFLPVEAAALKFIDDTLSPTEALLELVELAAK